MTHSKKQRIMFHYDYCPGKQLDLYTIPAPPLPAPEQLTYSDEDRDIETVHGRLGRCYLINPELPVQPPALTIQLDEHLGGGIRDDVSHIWTAHSLPEKDTFEPTEKLVAKFFDPLYFHDGMDGLDGWRVVNRHVVNECESYKRLSILPSGFIPEFYGLYLAAFPLPEGPLPDGVAPPSSRNVHVILMKHVPGKPLHKIDPYSLEPTRRDYIMDWVIDLYLHALAAGVQQEDSHPRNFILRDDTQGGISEVLMHGFETVEFIEPRNPIDLTDTAKRRRRIDNSRARNAWFSKGSSWGDDGWISDGQE